MDALDNHDERQRLLREKAESKMISGDLSVEDLSPAELKKLVHEYQVYQIELELQKEELLEARGQLELTRDRYAQLFYDAPAGYLVIDANGIIAKTNKTFASMLGREPRFLEDKALVDFISPDDHSAFLGRFKAFFKNPEGKELDFRLRGRNGDLMIVRCVGRKDKLIHSLPGDDARPKLLLMASDITEQVRANETLRDNERFLNLLLETIPIPVFYKDKQGLYQGINKAFENFFGKTAKELVGKSVFDVNPLHLARIYHAQDAELLAAPGIQTYESQVVDAREGLREVIFHKATVVDRHNRITGLIGAILDITERKNNETALKQSEEKYRELFENAPVGIFQATPEGRYLTMNTEMARIAGYADPSEMIRDISNIGQQLYVRPDEREIYKKTLHTCGQVAIFETELFRRDGTTFWASMNTKVKRNSEGNLVYDGFLTDVTKRRQAEQVSRERKQFLDTVLETTRDGFWVLDGQGRIIEVNRAYCRMSGYSKEELLRMSIPDLDAQEGPEEIAARTGRIVNQGSELFETRHRKKDGGLFDVEVVVSYLGGDPQRFVCFCRDITQRRRVEQMVNAQNEQLKTLLAEKDKFFSLIAHDLKSPMSALLVLAKMFAEDAEDLTMKELQDIAQAMHQSSQRLYTLLENLLQWALMQQGMVKLDIKAANLRDLVRTGVESLRSVSENKHIDIRNHIPENMMVQADSHMITTVIRNLVSNALKFTAMGGCVSISAIRNADMVEVAVQDNGVGMDQITAQNIFTLDKKMIMTGTQGESGTGLGLNLCKEFVEKHGGRIRVQSERGQGATFYFTIPGVE